MSMQNANCSFHGDPAQRFHHLLAARFRLDSALRNRLTELIRRSPKSRAQIADELSDLLEQRFTERQLNAWTALSMEQHRIPLAVIPALCEVLRDASLLRLVAGACGYYLITQQQRELLAAAQLIVRADKVRWRAQERFEELRKEGVA